MVPTVWPVVVVDVVTVVSAVVKPSSLMLAVVIEVAVCVLDVVSDVDVVSAVVKSSSLLVVSAVDSTVVEVAALIVL